jgi:putative hydrolase of the HAD superfamily
MDKLGITFDVWETLITDPYAMAQARTEMRLRLMSELLRKSGFRIDADVFAKAYEDSFWAYEDVWQTNIDLSTKEQVKVLIDLVDPRIAETLDAYAWDELNKAYIDPIFTFPPDPNDGVIEALEDVKSLGFRLGLICNTGRTPGWAVRQLLELMGITGYFEVLAFSDEEAIRKPAAEIFDRVVRKLGLPANRCVHIGDNPVADIAGAKGLGMNAILIRKELPEGLVVSPDAHIETLRHLGLALGTVFRGKGSGA